MPSQKQNTGYRGLWVWWLSRGISSIICLIKESMGEDCCSRVCSGNGPKCRRQNTKNWKAYSPLCPHCNIFFHALKVATDASKQGVGAVLLQRKDSDRRPVAFASGAVTDRTVNVMVLHKGKAAQSRCHHCVWMWESLQRLTVPVHFCEEDCWVARAEWAADGSIEQALVSIVLQLCKSVANNGAVK